MPGASSPHRCQLRPVILSADWGKRPRKRAVYGAPPAPRTRIARQPPPAAGWSLAALVELARRLRDECAAPVLIGIDAVIGLPRRHVAALGANGFLAALRALERAGGLAAEGEATHAETWKPERPFFRVPPGRGSLTRFYEAAEAATATAATGEPTGTRDAVLREVERRTRAKSVFVLSGIPGSVGSGSRALWQELLPVLQRRGAGPGPDDLHLWPFDGSLAELTAAPTLVLAEVYPRAAYAVALADDLLTRPRSLAKTRAATRAAALGELAAAPWLGATGTDLADLDAASANEDDFDALFTAAALTRLVAQARPLSSELVDPRGEGGILATGAVELPPS